MRGVKHFRDDTEDVVVESQQTHDEGELKAGIVSVASRSPFFKFFFITLRVLGPYYRYMRATIVRDVRR